MQSPPLFYLFVMSFLINKHQQNIKECIMKKLFFSIVSFFLLLVVGCQDNSITDPIVTESNGTSSKTSRDINSGNFPLEGILVAPGMTNNYFSISGRIDYTHQLFYLDPIPPAPQFLVKLHFDVSAVITDLNYRAGKTWTIKAQSDDNVYVSEEGVNILEKTFPINNRKDQMILKCRFIVTTNGVQLDATSLSFLNADHKISKNYETPGIITYPPVRVDNARVHE
jgi:hypothetical protein